jgi:hypothetical protein
MTQNCPTLLKPLDPWVPCSICLATLMVDSYTRYQRISRKRVLERPGRGGQQGEEPEIGTVCPSLSPLNHLLQKLRVRICKKHLHATYYILLKGKQLNFGQRSSRSHNYWTFSIRKSRAAPYQCEPNVWFKCSTVMKQEILLWTRGLRTELPKLHTGRSYGRKGDTTIAIKQKRKTFSFPQPFRPHLV